MFEMNIHISEEDSRHFLALRDALGQREFSRRFPGLEPYDKEVFLRGASEAEMMRSLANARDTEVPPETTARAIERLRESNERLSRSQQELKERLNRSEGRSSRNQAILGAAIGLLAVAATVWAAI
jgi:hypothetical protein